MSLIKCFVISILISFILCNVIEDDEFEAEIEFTLSSPQVGHKSLKINGTQLMDLNKKLFDNSKFVKETNSDSSVILIVVLIENFLFIAGFFIIKYFKIQV